VKFTRCYTNTVAGSELAILFCTLRFTLIDNDDDGAGGAGGGGDDGDGDVGGGDAGVDEYGDGDVNGAPLCGKTTTRMCSVEADYV
jgi:hypothetical protein